MKSFTRDMTVGSPFRLIIGFALPMLLGLLFQQFYNMADTIIVGKWLGVNPLAGVGCTSNINFMIVGFCTGLGTGLAIPIAQSFGANDYSRLRRFVANSMWFSVIIVPIITVIVSIFCKDILLLMKTPDDIIDYAYDYIFIIFVGLPILFTYNLLAAIIRSLGDSKTPVIFLIISAFINIVLDIISVGVFNMGVKGPALATVISQLVSVILCFVFIIKKFNILHLKKEEWHFEWQKILTLALTGIPMGLQYSITAIGGIILQSAVNQISSAAVATMSSSIKISQFVTCPYEALGGTMATYAGQNTGIGDRKRINKGVASAFVIGSIYALFAFAVLFLFGKQLALLFFDASETEIITDVHKYLTINGAAYLLLLCVNVLRFTIQGMGYSLFAILAGFFEMIARGVIGFFLVPKFGFIAACFSGPLAWLFADIFLIPAYFLCIHMMKKRHDKFSKPKESNQIASDR